MIDKLYGHYLLICDDCCETSEARFLESEDTMTAGYGDGWRMKGTIMGIEDLCPECAQK